jgi:hypothetical protein
MTSYSDDALKQVADNCRKLPDGTLHDIIRREDTSLVLKEAAKFVLIERGHPPHFDFTTG